MSRESGEVQQTWEAVEGTVGESYNGVDGKCEMLTNSVWRRRISTAAVLSEHCYKSTDALYDGGAAIERLRLLQQYWGELVQLSGAVKLLEFPHAPPAVAATDADTLYISFRGTKLASDWASGAHVRHRQMPHAPEGCCMHRGVLGRERQYCDDVFHSIMQDALHAGKHVVLAGHSLGGAVAGAKAASWALQRGSHDGVSAFGFAAPYWAGQQLAQHLSETGAARCLHQFFHPTDPVAAMFLSFGFRPVGYYYYTASPMDVKWAHQQFVLRVEEVPVPWKAAALATAAVSAAAVAAAEVLQPQRQPHFHHRHRSPLTRDFFRPYFVALREEPCAVFGGQRPPPPSADPPPVSSLRTGAARGVYRAAAPCSTLFDRASRFPSLAALMQSPSAPAAPAAPAPAAKDSQPSPVSVKDCKSGATVTFEAVPPGRVRYYVNHSEPRPPISAVVYRRWCEVHELAFPELGAGKAAYVHAGPGAVEKLQEVVGFLDAAGVTHDLPFPRHPSGSLISRASTALTSAATAACRQLTATVAAATARATDSLTHPHRVQNFVAAFLAAWGGTFPSPASPGSCLPSSLLRPHPAHSLVSVTIHSADAHTSTPGSVEDEEEEEEAEEETDFN